jgi:hypothetical protein
VKQNQNEMTAVCMKLPHALRSALSSFMQTAVISFWFCFTHCAAR